MRSLRLLCTTVQHVKVLGKTFFLLEHKEDFFWVISGKQRVSSNPCKYLSVGIRPPDLHFLLSLRLFVLLVGDRKQKRPHAESFVEQLERYHWYLKKQQIWMLISQHQNCKDLDFTIKNWNYNWCWKPFHTGAVNLKPFPSKSKKILRKKLTAV